MKKFWSWIENLVKSFSHYSKKITVTFPQIFFPDKVLEYIYLFLIGLIH